MNKRTITLLIISGIIAIGLIIGGVLLQYYASFHKVTISVKNPEITATVYKQADGVNAEDGKPNDTKLSSVKGTTTLSLQAGSYYVIPEGEKYDKTPIIFAVKDTDTKVTVDPGFSDTYLKQLLQDNLPLIKQVITTKYPFAATSYQLNDGKLYQDGTWYGTTLVQNAEAGTNGDVYRAILHKVGGTWQFAATPSLVISIPEHKDIPADIITDLNGQSGY